MSDAVAKVRAYIDMAGCYREAKVAVTFTLDELVKIAIDVDDENVRERIFTGIGLVDERLEAELRDAMREVTP